MKIRDITTSALFDSGSDVNFVMEKLINKCRSKLDIKDVKSTLSGLGNKSIRTLGLFSDTVTINDQDFILTFHIVPDDACQYEAVVGNELLLQAEVRMNQDGVVIFKEEDSNFVMQVSLEPEKDETPDLSHIVNKENKKIITQMLDEYKPKKTKSTNVTMKIIVKDDEPIYNTPRRLPFAEREIVDAQIEEWLRDGIIEPCESEYASQVVVVRKKDGSPRICIDYKKINKVCVKDRFPLPLIEDQLDELQDATTYSTIDLKNGFFHVAVDPESRKYTAFVTHRGQFWFLRVPFGFTNSPPIFQRFTYSVFRELINRKIAILYIDDVIIPSRDEDEGIKNLKEVLNVASEYGLEINKKKCQFLKKRVEFLGHVIEDGTIQPSPLKTVAVKNFPKPTTVKQVQSFLGLSGYFRKFMPSYALIAKPLSDLLKKDNDFKFGFEEEEAFEKLKQLLSSKPVLQIYRRDSETELHTDASKNGYGSVLLQKSYDDNMLHSVYYMSRKTTPAEENYDSYELEVLAIIRSLEKFGVYLLGREFKIVTDCSAFQKTMDKKN